MITVKDAAARLRAGELVIIPTETVYGLAADATNPAAIAKLDTAKQRADGKHYSWLVADLGDIAHLAELSDDAKKLADAFFPGPLTLVLNLKSGGTIGVRSPAHPVTLELLRELGTPLACPSANVSGQFPPTRFADANANFGSTIAALDGGGCTVGIESTVLDLTTTPPRVLRRGALTKRKLEEALGKRIDGQTIIGITGGSGTGKSMALTVLHEWNALIIDCDGVYHELLRTSKPMLAEIESRFPGVIENGELDRKKLGGIVFNDAAALADLSTITDAYVVGREVTRRIKEFDGKVIAIEAIALVQSGIAPQCDYNIAITAPRDLRIERIMARDGISREYAEARIAAQTPDDFFRKHCDIMLSNDTDPETFANKCREYFKTIIN